MEAFAIYLLKVSGILVIFWSVYRIFLHQETTFTSNRFLLLLGLPTALFLPLMKFKKLVYLDILPEDNLNAIIPSSLTDSASTASGLLPLVFTVTYFLGCLFFLTRLLIQLRAIRQLAKTGHIWREDEFVHIETPKDVAPFSFFKSLFYNPTQYQKTHLDAILTHEKVHAREWHSIDVLIGEVFKIVLWFNPLVWLYEHSMKQNLEFLADAKTVDMVNKKTYQYLMIKQATGQQIAITNSFHNSLTKKRIVMLNKKQSKRISSLKSLLVLPLLALFLYGFATKKEYRFKMAKNNTTVAKTSKFEFTIKKTTTDKELVQMKHDMGKDGIDFSYTTVRNEAQEIIDITLEVTGKGENGATFKNAHSSADSTNGITTVVILVDLESNLVSIGSKGTYNNKVTKIKKGNGSVWISSDGDEQINVWSGLDEVGEHNDIIIREENGTHKVFMNGDEVNETDDSHNGLMFSFSTDEDEDYDKQVKIKKYKSDKEPNVLIVKNSDDDEVIKTLNDEGFVFIDTTERSPLYLIDGKETTKKEIEKLSPKKIASINVIKDKSAVTKYGPKAKNGVIEITTKGKE